MVAELLRNQGACRGGEWREEQLPPLPTSVRERAGTATDFAAFPLSHFEVWRAARVSADFMQRYPSNDKLRSHLQFRNSDTWCKAMSKMSFGSKCSGKRPQ